MEVERQEQLEKNREEAIKVKSLLDSYVESTQILVSEKAELQSDLEKVKMELADIKGENFFSSERCLVTDPSLSFSR